METDTYKMIEECVDSYVFEDKEEEGAVITIVTSRRFANLWLEKLTAMETTDGEIAKFSID